PGHPEVWTGGRGVLFRARLHARKRPVAFVEMASELMGRGIDGSFAIVGPDDGELASVRESIANAGLQEVVRYEGALDYQAVLTRMRQAVVYVLPSVDE